MSAAEPSALAQTVARARRDMQGKLDRRAALTASLRLATSDAERRAAQAAFLSAAWPVIAFIITHYHASSSMTIHNIIVKPA